MIPSVGQRVGPYEILGRLGSGGMGIVFSAWDGRLQRDVAIKLLREEFLIREMRDRFLLEARAASGLNHPNICTIFDIGDQHGDPYLVMELLKGETLRSRISAGPISPEEILHVATETAEALAVAHARGIIHRDVKPANIFLVNLPGGKSQTKVLDFGLAKIDVGDQSSGRFELTGAGATVGTVSYMSPEQARGEQLDARSDLFSLGVVMYEMATGQVPFRGTTSALVFVQLLSHPPDDIRELNSNIPKDLEKMILKLLCKQRSDRYQTAAELAGALHKIVIKKPQPAKPRSRWSLLTEALKSRPVAEELDSTPPVSAAPSPAPSPTPAQQETQSPRFVSDVDSVLRPVRRTVAAEPPPNPVVDGFPVTPATWPAVNLVPAQANHAAASAASPSVAASPSAGEVPPSEAQSKPPVANPSKVEAAHVEPAHKIQLPPLPSLPQPIEQPPRVVRLDAPAPRRKLTPRFQDKDSDLPIIRTAELRESEPAGRGYKRWIWSACVVLLVAGLAAWRFAGPKAAVAPVAARVLMLASVANHTADSSLDGVLLEGLRIDLQQSTRISVQSRAELASAMHAASLNGDEPASMDDARQVADASGASTFLFGEIRNDGPSYIVEVRLYDSGSGAKTMSAEETAVSRDEITNAIDRLASAIRTNMGESSDLTARTSVPLRQEATANIDALQALIAGETALAAGRVLDGITSLQRATNAEPKLVQAWLELAETYREVHAEAAASAAATSAHNAAGDTSERTQWLAESSYELNATHDYPRAQAASERILATYPQNNETLTDLALELRLQGKFGESLTNAQSALARDARDPRAAAQAELSMLALDHADAADHLEEDMQRSGRPSSGLAEITALLVSRDVAAPAAGSEDPLSADFFSAEALDAQGKLRAGLVVWLALMDEAKTLPALASAGAYALSQAALNRALTQDCGEALVLARQSATMSRGEAAIFSAGMASGLCGDMAALNEASTQLTSEGANSFPVHSYYLAQLAAVGKLHATNAPAALTSLESARQVELLTLTPYLRALAYKAADQPQLAIVDFQGILLHRGAAMITAGPLYAMAQIGLARAYAASGDQGNSARAYARFLDLWKNADSENSLLVEARSHSR